MDLQTRKLNVIEYLIGLKDEKIFSKIESTIHEMKRDLKPFTQKQIVDRAKRSNDDYRAGKFISQDQLEKESDAW